MVATARKSQHNGGIEVDKAVVADVLKVLARHNPRLSKAALAATGKVMAAISAATARLSAEQQRRIAADEKELAQAVEAVVASLAEKSRRNLEEVPVGKPLEVSTGTGLGQSLGIEEGRRRLAEFATPARIEDWAGPVAGPGDIEKMFGTKRSTLHDWQKRGAAIGLLKGERKHVFPLAQFVDGRPVEGMSRIRKIIPNPRVAWQWLIQTKPSIGGAPLDRLKKGYVDEVVDAAARDFR
ncbi:hypothetical protein [Rhizobium mesoamericanum]|uniref:Antitoxin Xre/MbcA/ParS-like toxin-binding domain-containing protein n=1 Tax=Rhizobium mesoamericanum STM3625 TaxID=1211777 RepID=K0Q2P6_9HYPH|nr:hypothetical protein [Rhizobium mesoamericanum]CCM78482.1 conserved hypothetical protein [Rhizobium mesoamericanum STM3625]